MLGTKTTTQGAPNYAAYSVGKPDQQGWDAAGLYLLDVMHLGRVSKVMKKMGVCEERMIAGSRKGSDLQGAAKAALRVYLGWRC